MIATNQFTMYQMSLHSSSVYTSTNIRVQYNIEDSLERCAISTTNLWQYVILDYNKHFKA